MKNSVKKVQVNDYPTDLIPDVLSKRIFPFIAFPKNPANKALEENLGIFSYESPKRISKKEHAMLRVYKKVDDNY